MPISTFLNGRAPTVLRGLQMLALSDVGNVLTLSFTDDSGGGASQVWGTATAVACRIDPVGGRSGVTGGRVDERSTHVVTVPVGTTVAASSRFVIAGRGTFEVTATHEQTSEMTRTFEVLAL